jgi:hypothetical protein
MLRGDVDGEPRSARAQLVWLALDAKVIHTPPCILH